MKGKRLLILGAAFALGLSACANSATMVRKTPLRVGEPTTVASWSRSGNNNTSSGGTFSATMSGKSGYYQDGGTVGTTYNIQVLNSSAYWTTKPTSITFSAKVGGGSGNKDLTRSVEVVLLGNGGTTVSTTTVTDHITTAAGDDYTIDITPVNNVYGVKIQHEKESGFNARFFSYSLAFVAGSSSVTTYSVTYNANGATKGDAPVDNTDYNANGSVTVLGNSGNLVKFGYIFAGWNTEADGSGEDYEEDDTFTITENTTLYAQWSLNPSTSGTESNPFTVAEAIEAIDTYSTISGVCASGIVSEIVEAYNSSFHNISYNISVDGSTTGAQLQAYRGKGLNGDDFTGDSDLKVGATVVIYGNLKKHNSTYEFEAGNYLKSYTAPASTLVSIAASQPQTSFYLNDAFVFGGTVTATYSDNLTADVSSSESLSFSGYNMSQAGNQTVTVTYAEDGKSVTTTYTISVIIPTVAASVEFVAGTDAGSQTGTGTYTDIVRKDGVILTGTNTPLGNTDNYRIYKGKTLTISVFSGSDKVIKSIVFECTASGTAKYGPGCFAAQEGYSYDDMTGTWVGESTSVVFTAESEQVRATSIVVTTGNVSTTEEKVNAIETRASLAYNYDKNTTSASVNDVLNRSTTGITGTTYTAWSNKTGTSGAVYAGQSAGGNESIQLRSNNNNSGIVTTKSGGTATKVTVVWNSNTTANRTLNVYGKNSAYSAASDLYGNSAGTQIGTIVCGTSTELLIEDDYEYIGVRSNDGAMYLTSITIEWSGEAATFTFSKVALILGGFVSQDLWNELNGGANGTNIKGYGVIAAATEDLGVKTIKEQYDECIAADFSIDDSIAYVCDGENVRNFYTPLTESKLHPAEADETQKIEQQVDVDNTYYVWSLRKNISDYNEAFSAIAYIRLADKLVFFKEVSKTAKQAGQDLIDNGIYDGSEFEGSLGAFLG